MWNGAEVNPGWSELRELRFIRVVPVACCFVVKILQTQSANSTNFSTTTPSRIYLPHTICILNYWIYPAKTPGTTAYNMGQQPSGLGGNQQGGDNKDDKSKKKDKPKYEPPPPTTRIGRKKRKAAGPNASAKLPAVYPTSRCKLRYLRMQRIHDHLLLEEEYVENQERLRKAKAAKEGTAAPATAGADPDAVDRNADERGRVDDMRGSPMGVGTLEEMIDDDHAIVSSTTGPEYYVSIMSFVDKDLLEPGASVLLHHKSVSIVGVLTDDTDPLVSVMKLDKAPTESYADIGGLESQIQEVRESVELPLLHPELYEEMGIKPPKGVILYGAPGTGKTLLAKAVANQTSATFLRIVGSELIQKYLGDGPRLVRQLFQVAAENAPSIVFIDEIDAIGTKRYESTSGGEREIQRTMLELLNQLDGFDDRGDVKVIMATNKIDTLDPALIRPGRIDRKILFENPDQHTKRKIFTLHTSKMSLNEDVDLEEFINQKDDLSGADIKAICSEAGLMALRERRMRVQMADFRAARERVLKTKSEGEPEGLYL
ncbi:26S protease regulatory subunit 4 protein [Rutstroemia sp. NJR-2017a BBW]|nr:26S protease regulatory subunit 4 protein [Rutstroemia sp. NJR-2017a BBW]